MSSWSRLFEFGFDKSKIDDVSRRYPSVYEYAIAQNEISGNDSIVFKGFDSIFLLVDFGMSLTVAKQLYDMGVTSIRVSMRRKTRKAIESQPSAVNSQMLEELYRSRQLFGKWLGTQIASSELQNYVIYLRKVYGENSGPIEHELNGTILFLNKHYATNLDSDVAEDEKFIHHVAENNEQHDTSQMSNKTLDSNESDADTLVNNAENSEKKNELTIDEVIQLFWLLDFDISMKLYKKIQANNLNLTTVLQNPLISLPEAVNNVELTSIRKRATEIGLLKDSVALLVGFHVSPRLVLEMRNQGILRVSELTVEKLTQLLSINSFHTVHFEQELNSLQRAIQRYYDWRRKTKFDSFIVDLIVLGETTITERNPHVEMEDKIKNEVEVQGPHALPEKVEHISDYDKKQRKVRKRIFGFETLPNSLMDFLEMDIEPDANSIIRGRMSRKTLQDVADGLGVTRERIRQKESKIKLALPEFDEEKKLSKILKLYYFDDEEFFKVFGMNPIINAFMEWRFGRGETPAFEFVMNNTKMSEDVKEFMVSHNNVMKTPSGDFISLTINNIIDIVLEQNESRQLDVEELTDLYNVYVDSNGLDSSLKKEPKDLSKVARNDYHVAIKTTNGKFRYFDFSKIGEVEIDMLNDILDVPAGVYGIKYFYDNNRETMSKLKLIDAAELANLYKRIGYEKFPKLINIIRQSQVMVDMDSKDEFILGAIYDFDQKSLDDLVKYFTDAYGLQENTMKSLLLTDYREYITGDTIIAEVKLPEDEHFYVEAASRLTQPIYDRHEFERIIHNLDGSLVLTARLAKKLGYHERGNNGMLVQERFNSAISAVNELLFTNDIFDTNTAPDLESRLLKYKLYEAEINHKLLKISETKYMNIRLLEEKGISKDVLSDFIEAAINFVKEDVFFTLKSIVDSGFTHSLFDIGFEDVFYERLIFTSEKIRMVNTTGSVFVKLTNLDNHPSVADFISFVMEGESSADVDDLQKKMKDVYGIEISRDKITEKINMSDMMYSAEMNRIFASRQDMLDSIYG
ncbi:hypothetical protein [Weissella confusa]|uniref:hypothetical protein n=1 Tax=Weissella confusa TaxID=1583 RepID=UPI0022E7B0F4|nr:hypothetical protein [Weissella confusa]